MAAENRLVPNELLCISVLYSWAYRAAKEADVMTESLWYWAAEFETHAPLLLFRVTASLSFPLSGLCVSVCFQLPFMANRSVHCGVFCYFCFVLFCFYIYIHVFMCWCMQWSQVSYRFCLVVNCSENKLKRRWFVYAYKKKIRLLIIKYLLCVQVNTLLGAHLTSALTLKGVIYSFLQYNTAQMKPFSSFYSDF